MQIRFLKILLVFFVSVLICMSAYAEESLKSFAEMTIDELLNLRDQINILLEEKGYQVYFDIERGTKGESVAAIQERLYDLGFYTGKITGKYDSETQKAFKAFEKDHELTNDGLASREDQIVLFGVDAVPKATSEPMANAENNSKEKIKNMPDHDISFEYEGCMRYPDNHVGERYTLKGKVEQTLGNREKGFQIRFSVLGNVNEIIYVYINNDPGYNIIEGDWLVMELEMAGTVTYESVFGKEITIPMAVASDVVLR